MDVSSNIIGTVSSIFLLLFLGYGMKKARVLRAEDAHTLNTFVLYLTLPAFIFRAIYEYHEPIPWSIAKVPVVGFATIAVVLVIAYVLGRAMKVDRPTLGAMMVAAGFGNTGFLGYPVTQAAFGTPGALVVSVLYDTFAMALPLYLVGSSIAAAFAGERVEVRTLFRMLLLPPLFAVPLALALRPVPIPETVMNALGYLANGTVPLAMISLGLSLSSSSLRGYVKPAVAACVLKLAALPFITYFAFKAVGLSGLTLQAGAMEAGMPTSVMAAVVCMMFGANGKFVAGVVFVTTLLSILTIPMTLLILGVR